MAPVTSAGRVATMLYALIGIPLCLIVLAEFGKLLTVTIKLLWSVPRRLVLRTSSTIDDEFNLPPVVAILLAAVYIVGGACMYMQWEDWDYMEASYFIFISISTVGFGDVLPTHNKYFIASFAYQLFGLALVAMVINVVMDSLNVSLVSVKRGMIEAGKSVGIDLSGSDVAKNKTE